MWKLLLYINSINVCHETVNFFLPLKCQQQNVLKMCVFSAFLKANKVLQHLMSMGNAFHRRGPTTRKDRSPKLVSFVRGISSKCCSDERVRPGLCLFSRFARYRGPVPFRHRYTWRSILYSMRHLTGSQCRSFRTGVI